MVPACGRYHKMRFCFFFPWILEQMWTVKMNTLLFSLFVSFFWNLCCTSFLWKAKIAMPLSVPPLGAFFHFFLWESKEINVLLTTWPPAQSVLAASMPFSLTEQTPLRCPYGGVPLLLGFRLNQAKYKDQQHHVPN